MPMPSKLDIWRDIHALLAAFFLPIALIYVVTGGLYLLGFRRECPGRQPPAARQACAQRNADSGQSPRMRHEQGPKQAGKHGGGISGRKPTGIYDKLMLLHKAKGGPAFNVLGVAFAVSVLVIYVSGIPVCWSVPSRRRRMLAATAIGLVVTIAAAVASL